MDTLNIPEIKKYECKTCDKSFKYPQGLSKHKKKCKTQNVVTNNIINGSNNKVEQLLDDLLKNVKEQKEEIDKIKMINREEIDKIKMINREEIDKIKMINEKLVQDKIEMLEKNEKYLKSLINEAGSLTKTSVSALAYATKNFNSAPCLKSLHCDDYDKINMDDNDDYELVDVLICYFKQGLINKYLGDFIVKMYKTKNPEDQSLWSSDVARLNYIVKLVINENKEEWLTDKNGIKIRDTIVIPMLKYIDGKIYVYNKNKTKEIASCSPHEITSLLNKISIAAEISRDIGSGSIARDIIKYIAPHFSIDINLLTK